MIRTLAVNCAPILRHSTNDEKTAMKTDCDEMAMGAAQAFCEFSLLVSQQNHSDLSLKAVDNTLEQVDQETGIFRVQKLSNSATAQVDDLLTMVSQQLHERKSPRIRAALEALVYWAEKVSSTKRKQFQVGLNRAWQEVTSWSAADYQQVRERLESEIHQVTPAKRKPFDKLFQHLERPLLQEVGTKATGPRSIFGTPLGVMKTGGEAEAYEEANMTADKGLQFEIPLSDGETETTTRRLDDIEHVPIQLEGEIYGITSKQQKHFKTEFSIHLIELDAWWETIDIQTLQKTIEQRVIPFGYPTIHLVSYTSESIRGMGSSDNCTADISERLHIANVEEESLSSNKVICI